MVVVEVLGFGLIAGSAVLAWKREAAIKHVTSRSLGSLAPGYAASDRGFLIYAGLVGDIGLVLIALALGNPWLIVGAIAVFIVGSIAAVLGEVVTYRALRR